MDVTPVVLQGRHVHLLPMETAHSEGLWRAGQDPELWRHTTLKVFSRDEMDRYVANALKEQERGVSIPFTTTDASSGAVVGSTRFMAIAPEHRRVEIGSTFLAPSHQRTPANTEAKYLMLRHAFEVWAVNRVELKTGSLNTKSRTAIARIGGVEEGTLRYHMINADGFIRDTVYFSFIAPEWPAAKARLEEMLARTWAKNS